MASAPDVGLPFFGARFSLYPMSDRYVPIILGAIAGIREDGLEVETDDVSTFVGGDRNAIWNTLERVFAKAAATGEHVVMTALVSHGCPGETYCQPDPRTGTAIAMRQSAGPSVKVSAQWSLYPLGVAGYMEVIYGEIERTKQAGVFSGGAHFVSKLEGDLGAVLGGIRATVDDACGRAEHVVAHLSLSANSPTTKTTRGVSS